MSSFSASELAGFRSTQTAHMMDTCILQTRTGTPDSYGQVVESFSGSATTACGLDMRPGAERHGVDYVALQYDATVRLPITATPDPKDRVSVTARFGESLAAPLVFDIVGPIQRGPSGIRLLLQRVET